MTKVLIVDDDALVRSSLMQTVATQGLEPLPAEDAAAALAAARKHAPAAVLLDLGLPDRPGMELLPELAALDPEAPVIILTGQGDIRSVVQAMRLGAYDYLTKPYDVDQLLISVRRALDRRALTTEVRKLQERLREEGPLRELMGPSVAIQAVVRQIHQVADSSLTVLIQGETGTGKELVARALHQASPRRGGPFDAVDCGAIPDTLVESELFGHEKGAFTGADSRKEGRFQLARRGTLFLDEVGNLPPGVQAKLLRVLEERQVRPLGSSYALPVDVRILAASNVPLEPEVRAGRFRADLYYRLSEFTIALPPLRERPEDVLPLATRFLAEARMEMKRPVRGMSEEAGRLLQGHGWPGNVRELKNAIRRAVLLATDVVGAEHLADLSGGMRPVPAICASPWVVPGLSLREAAERASAAAETDAIRAAIEAAGGNKSHAARLLRTDFKTLHLKMKRYGIATREFRSA